jgi:hypothetical protein
MKRAYSTPHLTEFGRFSVLTQGDFGTYPDFIFTGTSLIADNSNCTIEPGSIETGCVLTGIPGASL